MSIEPAIEEQIVEIVTKLIAGRTAAVAVASDNSLIEAGMNSIDMVNLLLQIEETFGIEVPSRAVNPKNFYSVKSVAGLVRDTLSKAA